MPIGKIVTLDDRLRDAKGRPISLAEWILHQVRTRYGDDVSDRVRERLFAGEFAPVAIAPEVNAGRWIVRCSICTAAQVAPREAPLFLCLDCLHERYDGRPGRIVWPPDHEVAATERVLMARAIPHTRSRETHETIDMLREQNIAAGEPTGDEI